MGQREMVQASLNAEHDHGVYGRRKAQRRQLVGRRDEDAWYPTKAEGHVFVSPTVLPGPVTVRTNHGDVVPLPEGDQWAADDVQEALEARDRPCLLCLADGMKRCETPDQCHVGGCARLRSGEVELADVVSAHKMWEFAAGGPLPETIKADRVVAERGPNGGLIPLAGVSANRQGWKPRLHHVEMLLAEFGDLYYAHRETLPPLAAARYREALAELRSILDGE